MAKPKASTHSTTVKPLTSRPLDLLYYGFFVFHFICTIAIDILPLWPEQLRTLPVGKQLFGIFKGVVDDYTLKTNDPFMLATWGLVQREWEFLFLKVFMWMEVYVYIKREPKNRFLTILYRQIYPNSIIRDRNDRSSTRQVESGRLVKFFTKVIFRLTSRLPSPPSIFLCRSRHYHHCSCHHSRRSIRL